MHLAETHRYTGEWERFIEEKQRSPHSPVMVKFWLEVIGIGNLEANYVEVEFHVIALENIFVFL